MSPLPPAKDRLLPAQEARAPPVWQPYPNAPEATQALVTHGAARLEGPEAWDVVAQVVQLQLQGDMGAETRGTGRPLSSVTTESRPPRPWGQEGDFICSRFCREHSVPFGDHQNCSEGRGGTRHPDTPSSLGLPGANADGLSPPHPLSSPESPTEQLPSGAGDLLQHSPRSLRAT